MKTVTEADTSTKLVRNLHEYVGVFTHLDRSYRVHVVSHIHLMISSDVKTKVQKQISSDVKTKVQKQEG
jgi:hypothetical protein